MKRFELRKKAFPNGVNQHQHIVIEMPTELEEMTVDGIIEDGVLQIHKCAALSFPFCPYR